MSSSSPKENIVGNGVANGMRAAVDGVWYAVFFACAVVADGGMLCLACFHLSFHAGESLFFERHLGAFGVWVLRHR